MLVLNSEYGNVNANREYPFEDGATLKDADGRVLPADFIVDACLYPIGVTGPFYLSAVDMTAGLLYIADVNSDTVVATAQYTQGVDYAPVYEYGANTFGRQTGVITLGAGLSEMTGGRLTRNFTKEATTFAAGVAFPLIQPGVRGILLPDGTLVTGDVTLEGRDGVYVTSRVAGGIQYLRVDVIGEPASLKEECEPVGPPICTIRVEQAAASDITASEFGGAIALAIRNVSMDDICAAAKAPKRPNHTDPCEPAENPPNPPEGTANSFDIAVCEGEGGTLTITAPSALGYVNPISVKTTAGVGPAASLKEVHGDDAAMEEAAENFRSPPALAGTVVIRINGLGKGQL